MKTKCSCCGVVINKTPSQLRMYKNNFCSTTCRDDFRKKREELKCEYCGTLFQRIPSHIGSHGSKHSYCSKRCSELDRVKDTHYPTKSSWESMLYRCGNKNSIGWENYGGRGIKVCERWNVYENFIEDMGERPNGMSLDRIDVNKGYFKENCRWATSKQQARNTRKNRIVEHNGESKCLMEWCEKFGLEYRSTWHQVVRKGLPLGQAMSNENFG